MLKTFLLLFVSCLIYTLAPAQKTKFIVVITPLSEGFYVHTSYSTYKGEVTPANGLIVDTPEGALLIDTGWDVDQTKQIRKWVKKHLKKDIRVCIISHSHADRSIGSDYLQQHGVQVMSTSQTAEKMVKDGLKRPSVRLPTDTTFRIGSRIVRPFYPGEGHTSDNIVVWFPEQRVLFGGCLVKSTEAKDKGYIGEANLVAWPVTIQKVMAACPDPAFVIPGHQGWGSVDALQYTIDLIKQ